MGEKEEIYETEPAPKKGAMPFLEHIEELRRRLIKSFLAVIIAAAVAFIFAERLYKFVTLPLGDIKLHFPSLPAVLVVHDYGHVDELELGQQVQQRFPDIEDANLTAAADVQPFLRNLCHCHGLLLP